jgi:hypothetical protein
LAPHETQSVASGPVQVVHEAWQLPHSVLAVAVHPLTWYWPAPQDEQLRHAPDEK